MDKHELEANPDPRVDRLALSERQDLPRTDRNEPAAIAAELTNTELCHAQNNEHPKLFCECQKGHPGPHWGVCDFSWPNGSDPAGKTDACASGEADDVAGTRGIGTDATGGREQALTPTFCHQQDCFNCGGLQNTAHVLCQRCSEIYEFNAQGTMCPRETGQLSDSELAAILCERWGTVTFRTGGVRASVPFGNRGEMVRVSPSSLKELIQRLRATAVPPASAPPDSPADIESELTRIDMAYAPLEGPSVVAKLRCLIKNALIVASPASAWRAIASAPKDGTEVIVFDEGAIFFAWFDTADGCWCEPNGNVEPPPTLWQPMPDPPARAAEA